MKPDASFQKAIVVNSSRRHAVVSTAQQALQSATISTKALEVTVGDKVELTQKGNELVIKSILPRKNFLARSYRGETRGVVANLDRLFIVTAVGPLFNTLSIDRMATVAYAEGIPLTIIVNKIDLGIDSEKSSIEAYRRAGFELLLISAKFRQGMETLEKDFASDAIEAVCFSGISGVGKSTILNRLLPEAQRATAEVSTRTGQGKQTTTQPCGFLYPRSGLPGLLLIDLPGIQQFGVAHLNKEQVADSFAEIVQLSQGCEFDNCAHIREQNCAVIKAVGSDLFPEFRYQSYLHMLAEIEEAQEY